MNDLIDTAAERKRLANNEAILHRIPSYLDALDAARERAERAEAERDAWLEMIRLHSKAEAAFLAWLRSAGEHMRAFGVTICDDGSDAGEVLAAKVPECAKAMADRITALEAERDQALAGLAAVQREVAYFSATHGNMESVEESTEGGQP